MLSVSHDVSVPKSDYPLDDWEEDFGTIGKLK